MHGFPRSLQAVLIVVFCAFGAVAYPQTRAILKTGAEKIRGIPELPLNSIPGLRGVYEVSGQKITVYFTRELLVIPNNAVPEKGLPFVSVIIEDKHLSWYRGKDYFLVVAADRRDAQYPEFLSILLDRFSYYMTYSLKDADVSFPAVLILK